MSANRILVKTAQPAQLSFHDRWQRDGDEVLHVVLNFAVDQEILDLDD